MEWSETHGFFADMGGVRIRFLGSDPFPVNSYQLHWLLKNGHIGYPDLDSKILRDKDKADRLVRALTLFQVLWFTVESIARGVQGLRLTTLELLTLAYAWCAMNALYFWYNKPLDVDNPLCIECDETLHAVLKAAGHSALPAAAWYTSTPLDFIQPGPRLSYVEPFFGAFVQTFNLYTRRRMTPVSSFNTMTVLPHGLLFCDVIFALVFVPAYYAVELAGWNFFFPTTIETILWRVTAITQATTCTCFLLAVWPGCYIGRLMAGADRPWTMEQTADLSRWVSSPLFIPTISAYLFSRAYVIVAGFLSLRKQPGVIFHTVNWWAFIPHL